MPIIWKHDNLSKKLTTPILILLAIFKPLQKTYWNRSTHHKVTTREARDTTRTQNPYFQSAVNKNIKNIDSLEGENVTFHLLSLLSRKTEIPQDTTVAINTSRLLSPTLQLLNKTLVFDIFTYYRDVLRVPFSGWTTLIQCVQLSRLRESIVKRKSL